MEEKIYTESDIEYMKKNGATRDEIEKARKITLRTLKKREIEEIKARVRDASDLNYIQFRKAKERTVKGTEYIGESVKNAQLRTASQYYVQGISSIARAHRTRGLRSYRLLRGLNDISRANQVRGRAFYNTVSTSGIENMYVSRVPDTNNPDTLIIGLNLAIAQSQELTRRAREAIRHNEEAQRIASAARAESRREQARQGSRAMARSGVNAALALGNIVTGHPIRAITRGAYAGLDAMSGLSNVSTAAFNAVADTVREASESSEIYQQKSYAAETEAATQRLIMERAALRASLSR